MHFYFTILFTAAIGVSWSQYLDDGGFCCDPDSYDFNGVFICTSMGVEIVPDGLITDPDCSDYSCPADLDEDGICDEWDDCVDLAGPSWVYFPPNDTISCDEMMPTVEETMPEAEDDCGPVDVIWVADGPFEYPFGCLQSYTCPRVYKATYGAGNVLLDTLIITVLDTVAPVLAYPTEELLFVNELDGESVPAIEAFVIDNCDTNAAYEATESVLAESGDTITLERVYVAADACGNTTVFTQVITVVQAFEGCTDLEACNYSDESNLDDDSCTYAEEGLDCDGNCLSDVDGDGYCDPEVTGCTDEAACNYVELATEDDGSCKYCSCLGEEQAGYGLLLEVHAEHTEGELSGMTTYRMYITTPNTNDFISAIYGDNESPMEIATSTSFYQHPFGSALGTNINPLLYSGFPELEFDSWLTMGLDAPPGPGEVAPSTIGDLDNGWVSNFEAGMNIVIEDSIGGAMFVTNDPGTTNIVSGEEQRILIGQFTTVGDMSGVINAQMFTEGVTDPADRVTLEFDGVGLHVGGGDVVCGCMDELACNYDATANNDDSSCEYESCLGCTLPFACNYDETAILDDGSCEFICPGCTDASACNYDSGAIQDDGSCSYPEDDGSCDCEGNQLDALGVCGGTCAEDVDEDGICDDVDDCVGQYDECGVCQGPGAIYTCGCADAPEGFCDCDGNVLDECGVCGGAGIPEGDCDCNGNVLDECGVCGGDGIPEGECDCNGNILDECGVCAGDGSTLDECGVCNGDNSSCTGCTYEFACNYDTSATILDVSLCEFGVCGGCMQLTACNYNPTVLEDDGSCEWCSCAEVDPGLTNSGYSLILEEYASHASGELQGMVTYRLYVGTPNDNDIISAIFGDDETPLSIATSTSFYQHPFGSSLGSNNSPLFYDSFPELEFDSWLTIGLDGPAGDNEVAPSTIGDLNSGWVSDFEEGMNVVIDDSIGGALFVLNEQGITNILSGGDQRILIGQFTTSGEMSGVINVQMFTGGSIEHVDYPTMFFDGVGEHLEEILNEGCNDPSASNYCQFYNFNDGSCIYDYVGCTDETACNYSATASVSDQNLCVYIPEGECDCDGNVFDECGVCGGDGIPEGKCDCAGNVLDECGVCGGDGIPEGQCDCEGNVLDECGVCGGEGIPEGECDCEGNVLDECGVCGGPGIAEGACDCAGNVLDALGVCGGDCLTDQNNNGICDLTELENPVGGPETCGLGTVWDEETQTCIVAYPADINFDGCVQLNDLLDLLSAYGLCQDD